jgi:hypothetical protein
MYVLSTPTYKYCTIYQNTRYVAENSVHIHRSTLSAICKEDDNILLGINNYLFLCYNENYCVIFVSSY